jgi:hypothetical protein
MGVNPPPQSTDDSVFDTKEKKTKPVTPHAISTKFLSSQFLNSASKNTDERHHVKINACKNSNASAEIESAPASQSTGKIGNDSAVMTSPISSFPHRTSAYLQSLAEICHAILWDARWRVGGSHQRHLFAWERGDDMNAIHKLSRRYIQIPASSQQRNHGFSKQAEHDELSTAHDDNARNMDNIQSSSGDSNAHNSFADDSDEMFEETHESNVDCDPDDRCLETYSRLYFRKGPWFRLDNVYKSYYMPKNRQSTQRSSIPTDPSTIKDSIAPTIKKPISPSKFFRRRNNKGHQNASSGTNCKKSWTSSENYIDHEFVDLQMEAVVVLVRDIERLFRIGLIRTFLSEEECGKTVGKRREKYDFAAAPLLRQDEQRTILAKLGGGRKVKHSNVSPRTSPTPEQQQQPLENLIWKQMCQQQTIFHSFKTGRNSTVLPVINHVHKILLEKWASAIILKASKTEYIPSPVLRSATKAVYEALLDLTSNSEITSTIMCFRLREAPVRTLRRACRLYLCATSGPGDMRNSGSNAWRSLPESHTKDLRKVPLRTNLVPPPGSSWNTVCYPGKDWRLRVQSCNFTRAFKPMLVNQVRHGAIVADTSVPQEDELKNGELASQVIDTTDDQEIIQVFSSVQAFHQWELGVELRENCDFLLELNELILYNKRKRARETGDDDESDACGDEVDNENCNNDTDQSSLEDGDASMSHSKVDFLDLLTIGGRAKIIRGLLAAQNDNCKAILSAIEQDVSTLLGIPFGDRPLSTLIVSTATEMGSSGNIENSRLENECERILGVIAIILIHILEFRCVSIHRAEVKRITKRPWLRHMYWDGCMSYILWDIIPILERRGYHEFAISALEVLLFGRRLPRSTNKIIPDSFLVGSDIKQGGCLYSYQPLVSRRARGKAIDRLIIDYTHFVRKNNHAVEITKSEKTQKPARSKKKKPQKSIVNEVVTLITEPIIRNGVVSGQITFSSIRTLARRLKRPLSLTLQGLKSFETGELGHRLSNGEDSQQVPTKYNDWTPITDTAVANAIENDRDSIGGRCSFVGFEEDEHAVRVGSLNVETLAKEYYHQGKLPADDESTTKGGWTGYHDEGGKIRVLFRILSSATLGMDWNSAEDSFLSTSQAPTIHLTPYQGAPFDLHVGAERVDPSEVGCGGMYIRRKSSIENFLVKLSSLDGEEISAFVHDCINKRVQYTNSLHRPDLMLESDLKQVRTLSMLAVGFGGKMLASIFRCFFFDYRHYSGGLPDLLLVRALYTPANENQSIACDRSTCDLVDLGEWVGEEFSSEHQESIKAKQAVRILMDTDSDFLGCSKVGDSGGRATNRFHQSGRRRNLRATDNNGSKEDDPSNDEDSKIPYSMPEKLNLTHNSRSIRVECMFVEVKSQNDRLDSRQEDWLNILDQHGNARVCKFEKAPKRDKRHA